MAPTIVVVVPEGREGQDLLAGFHKAKAQMPMRVLSAQSAPEGVAACKKAASTGGLHVAFLHARFTAKGKEEFSDTLREFLKLNLPKTPVVAFGSDEKKAGDKRDFTSFMPTEGGEVVPQLVIKTVQQYLSGAAAGGAGPSSARKSLDASGQRRSLDSAHASTARMSLERRASLETPASQAARASTEMARRSMEMRYGDSPRGSMDAGAGLARFNSRVPMEGAYSAHGSFEAANSARGSFEAQHNTRGGFEAPMDSAAYINVGLSPLVAKVPALVPMPGGILVGNGNAGAPAEMQPISLVGQKSMGVGSGLYSFGSGIPLEGAVKAPASLAAPVAAPAAGGLGASPNGELIRMLSEEVVRLRVAVEHKRASQAGVASHAPPALPGPLGL